MGNIKAKVCHISRLTLEPEFLKRQYETMNDVNDEIVSTRVTLYNEDDV